MFKNFSTFNKLRTFWRGRLELGLVLRLGFFTPFTLLTLRDSNYRPKCFRQKKGIRRGIRPCTSSFPTHGDFLGTTLFT